MRKERIERDAQRSKSDSSARRLLFFFCVEALAFFCLELEAVDAPGGW